MIYLEHGAWTAAVVPRCGANLVSLCYNGNPILRSPDTVEQLMQRPCLYGLPFLFPANRVKGASFNFKGKHYELPMNEPVRNNHIHGLLKDAEFSVIAQSRDSVHTSLQNNGQYYPFPFEISFTDKLTDKGFVRQIDLYNVGDLPMPYTMAFHATFAAPGSFAVPVGMRYLVDNNYIPTGAFESLADWEERLPSGLMVDGRVISGFFTSCGNTVRIGDFAMTVSSQFDHWVLYNGNGQEGFLCIEPQCGAVDGLNNGRCRILDAGARETLSLGISLFK